MCLVAFYYFLAHLFIQLFVLQFMGCFAKRPKFFLSSCQQLTAMIHYHDFAAETRHVQPFLFDQLVQRFIWQTNSFDTQSAFS